MTSKVFRNVYHCRTLLSPYFGIVENKCRELNFPILDLVRDPGLPINNYNMAFESCVHVEFKLFVGQSHCISCELAF